jgi:hypothetical protein
VGLKDYPRSFLRLLRLSDCDSSDKEHRERPEALLVHVHPAYNATDMPQTDVYENHIFTENSASDVNQFDYTQ